MRVQGQVASPSASAQVGKQQFTVTGARINDPNDSALQPRLHMTSCYVNRHHIFEDPRIGPQPNEAKSNYPRQAYRRTAGKTRYPPLARLAMERRRRIVGVDKQVDIGNDQDFTLFALCPDGVARCPDGSASHANSLNRRSSIPGNRRPGCGRSWKGGSFGPRSPSPRLNAWLSTVLNGIRLSRAISAIRSARSSSTVNVVLMLTS